MCKVLCAGLCPKRCAMPARQDFTSQMGADFGWVDVLPDRRAEGLIAARGVVAGQGGEFGGRDQA